MSSAAPLRSELANVLGVSPKAPAEPPPETRYELLGVVTPRSKEARDEGEGLALIAINGQARTLRVGAEIEGLQLVSIEPRAVTLAGEGKAPVVLRLPMNAPNRSLPPATTVAAAPVANPGAGPVTDAAAVPQASPTLPVRIDTPRQTNQFGQQFGGRQRAGGPAGAASAANAQNLQNLIQQRRALRQQQQQQSQPGSAQPQ